MSRNERHRKKTHVGQKGPKIGAPMKSPANTSTNKNTSSSDDDYAGVDLISDTSDADEPDVEEVEATAIVESGRVTDSDEDSEYPPNEDDQMSFGDFDLPEYNTHDEPQFFEEQILSMPVSDTGATEIGGSGSVEKTHRRARAQSHLPSSSSSDSEDDSFDPDFANADDPDSFWALDSLAPEFQRAIGGNDDAVASSEASSYWDLEAERGQQQAVVENEDDNEDDESNESSPGSSSGYETDEGETTDEDLPIGPRFIPPERSVLRPTKSSDVEEEIPVTRRKLPRFGSFVQDDEKPFAMVDSSGKHLMMFRAKDSRPNTATQDYPLISPMITSANVMVSATLNASSDFYGNQAFGPPEAFFSHPSIYPGGSFVPAESSSYDEDDDDDDDGENLLKIEDIIDFGETSSDEDPGDKSGEDVEPPSSTPTRAIEASKERANLLEHLDGGLVSAFRNNQRQHQLLSRNEATREGLAFASRFTQGPIRGIKGGRLAAANTPITPMRKQKSPKNIVESSPGSPLARAAAQKRKASAQVSQKTHKRNRSIL